MPVFGKQVVTAKDGNSLPLDDGQRKALVASAEWKGLSFQTCAMRQQSRGRLKLPDVGKFSRSTITPKSSRSILPTSPKTRWLRLWIRSHRVVVGTELWVWLGTRRVLAPGKQIVNGGSDLIASAPCRRPPSVDREADR